MVLILGTETIASKTESDAEIFVPSPDLEPAVVPTHILDVLAAQKPIAYQAMALLEGIAHKRDIIETAAAAPRLISEAQVDDARGHVQDWSTMWNRTIDAVSHAIVSRFPNQRLGSLGMQAGEFFSDSHRLFADKDGAVFGYTSMLENDQLHNGVKRANQEQWHNFLARLTLLG
jgi:hypothetical protein